MEGRRRGREGREARRGNGMEGGKFGKGKGEEGRIGGNPGGGEEKVKREGRVKRKERKVQIGKKRD